MIFDYNRHNKKVGTKCVCQLCTDYDFFKFITYFIKLAASVNPIDILIKI